MAQSGEKLCPSSSAANSISKNLVITGFITCARALSQFLLFTLSQSAKEKRRKYGDVNDGSKMG